MQWALCCGRYRKFGNSRAEREAKGGRGGWGPRSSRTSLMGPPSRPFPWEALSCTPPRAILIPSPTRAPDQTRSVLTADSLCTTCPTPWVWHTAPPKIPSSPLVTFHQARTVLTQRDASFLWTKPRRAGARCPASDPSSATWQWCGLGRVIRCSGPVFSPGKWGDTTSSPLLGGCEDDTSSFMFVRCTGQGLIHRGRVCMCAVGGKDISA